MRPFPPAPDPENRPFATVRNVLGNIVFLIVAIFLMISKQPIMISKQTITISKQPMMISMHLNHSI